MTDLFPCFCIILTYISLDSARYRHILRYVAFQPFKNLSAYLMGLCGYRINRAILQESSGIPRLIGLCGYGIRQVVTNVDERDILPRIIMNELD